MKKISDFLSVFVFPFLVVKVSIYLNRRVFVMILNLKSIRVVLLVLSFN